jgi:hypothetical protein
VALCVSGTTKKNRKYTQLDSADKESSLVWEVGVPRVRLEN